MEQDAVQPAHGGNHDAGRDRQPERAEQGAAVFEFYVKPAEGECQPPEPHAAGQIGPCQAVALRAADVGADVQGGPSQPRQRVVNDRVHDARRYSIRLLRATLVGVSAGWLALAGVFFSCGHALAAPRQGGVLHLGAYQPAGTIDPMINYESDFWQPVLYHAGWPAVVPEGGRSRRAGGGTRLGGDASCGVRRRHDIRVSPAARHKILQWARDGRRRRGRIFPAHVPRVRPEHGQLVQHHRRRGCVHPCAGRLFTGGRYRGGYVGAYGDDPPDQAGLGVFAKDRAAICQHPSRRHAGSRSGHHAAGRDRALHDGEL